MNEWRGRTTCEALPAPDLDRARKPAPDVPAGDLAARGTVRADWAPARGRGLSVPTLCLEARTGRARCATGPGPHGAPGRNPRGDRAKGQGLRRALDLRRPCPPARRRRPGGANRGPELFRWLHGSVAAKKHRRAVARARRGGPMRPAHTIPAPGPMLATGSGPKRRWHVSDARAPKRDT